MLVKELPFYVKFIFKSNGENGLSISTTDIDFIKSIKYSETNDSINRLEISQKIVFDKYQDDIYQITEISISNLVENTDSLNYGININDCIIPNGETKQHLFTIKVDLIKC